MGKVTGLEEIKDVPPKVLGMYRAVVELIEEGADIAGLRVSTITDRAGIGKGTAYEYFETKEEIVACAMVYYMQWLFDWLGRVLLEKESFQEQLNYLLDEMERKNGRKYCFLRFVHILTDNSEFSQLIRQKLGTREAEKWMPMAMFEKVLARAVERGELRDDLPMDYMVYCVFAHLLTYMMAISTEQSFHVDPGGMRPHVYRGILEELCGPGQEQG